MWVYDQSSGKFYRQIGNNIDSLVFVAQGYSGKDFAKNRPDMENRKSLGPIPRGLWRMTGVHDSKNVGPHSIILEPEPGTRTHGRSAFRIHGDSVKNPGTASRGCIILPRKVREEVWKSGDRILRVME